MNDTEFLVELAKRIRVLAPVNIGGWTAFAVRDAERLEQISALLKPRLSCSLIRRAEPPGLSEPPPYVPPMEPALDAATWQALYGARDYKKSPEKRWLVWGDNGEKYDDHIEWVESIHASAEGAAATKDTLTAQAALTEGNKTTYSVVESEVKQ